ncbi:MAG: hypothetical protein M3R38_29855 [Actinomycetota bacterium]|nr:hypothetical protein [Actinomycetota bacterium]
MTEPFIKDPQARLDYSLDWSAWLASGETITASTWAATTGITVEAAAPYAPSFTGTATTVWLSGGTIGGGEEIGISRGTSQRAYRVTNTITTSAGRTDERSIFVAVAER